MISFIFKIITLNYTDLKHSVWLALNFSCKSSHEVNMTTVICTFTYQVMTGQSTFVHNNLLGQPVNQPRAGPGHSPTRPLAPKLNRPSSQTPHPSIPVYCWSIFLNIVLWGIFFNFFIWTHPHVVQNWRLFFCGSESFSASSVRKTPMPRHSFILTGLANHCLTTGVYKHWTLRFIFRSWWCEKFPLHPPHHHQDSPVHPWGGGGLRPCLHLQAGSAKSASPGFGHAKELLYDYTLIIVTHHHL